MVKTKIHRSEIHGLGLFADQFIAKGTLIWRFTSGFDLKFTSEEVKRFPELLQTYISKYAWLSRQSGFYCFASDDGKYFNHSDKPNAISRYDFEEDEVVTTAIQNIRIDEEITDNYSSFDAEHTQKKFQEVTMGR